jgi:polysaccharide export outer membrane protein
MLTKTAGLKAGVCAVVALSLGACSSSPDPVIGVAASAPRADLGQAGYSITRSDTYLLRSSDAISVTVFREPDFSLERVRIGVEGNVSLPMLGSVPAAGMTAVQFEQDVTRRLAAAGLRTPMVSVNISEYASHLVTVEGAVAESGVFTFQPGARLSAAVAMSGGLERTARSEQVAVFREGPEGITIAKFDYGQVSQGTMLDPILEPGDRVVVGTDGLSVFWQDLLIALPAFGIFANVAVR